MMAALVDIETLILRPEPFVAQVPFAGEEGGVAIFLERLGEGELLELQLARVGCGQEPGVAPPRLAGGRTDVIRHARARGVTAGHDTRTRGAADGAGGVGAGEFHARSRKPIAIGRVVKRAAKGFQVAPSEIIDEKKYEVERLGFLISLSHSRAQECQ